MRDERNLVEKVRDWAIVFWLTTQILMSIWGIAQQTLIARSEDRQKMQQLQQELERAKTPAPAPVATPPTKK